MRALSVVVHAPNDVSPDERFEAEVFGRAAVFVYRRRVGDRVGEWVESAEFVEFVSTEDRT